MTIDEFWNIIEEVHAQSGGDMDKKCVLLGGRLRRLSPDELRSFRSHFDQCYFRAYDWDLWGAAYLINGGCSDDSFSDFRSTLISQGRGVFERAVAEPDSLADLPLTEEGAFYEGYAYVVTQVEEEVLGEVPFTPGSVPEEPSGEDWDHDDDEELAKRFPRLHLKYSGPGADPNPKKPWWKIW